MGINLKNIVKKLPFFEAVRAFLEQWGLWKYLAMGGSLVVASLYTVWTWLTANLPPWGLGLVLMATFAIMLAIFNYGYDTYRKIRAERIDHDAVANELIRLGDEMARAITDYHRERAFHRRGGQANTEPSSPFAEFEEKIAEGEMLVRHISERFGRRIIAAVLVLKRLEVSIPFHMSHMHESTLMSLSSFFGGVGQLIKSGNLSVAQKLDDRTNWEISGMIR